MSIPWPDCKGYRSEASGNGRGVPDAGLAENTLYLSSGLGAISGKRMPHCPWHRKSGAAAEVIGLPEHSIGEHPYMAKIYLETANLFAWTPGDHSGERCVWADGAVSDFGRLWLRREERDDMKLQICDLCKQFDGVRCFGSCFHGVESGHIYCLNGTIREGKHTVSHSDGAKRQTAARLYMERVPIGAVFRRTACVNHFPQWITSLMTSPSSVSRAEAERAYGALPGGGLGTGQLP